MRLSPTAMFFFATAIICFPRVSYRRSVSGLLFPGRPGKYPYDYMVLKTWVKYSYAVLCRTQQTCVVTNPVVFPSVTTASGFGGQGSRAFSGRFSLAISYHALRGTVRARGRSRLPRRQRGLVRVVRHRSPPLVDSCRRELRTRARLVGALHVFR